MVYQGARRSALRTITLRNGLRLQYRLNRGDLQSIREVWLDEVYRFPAELGTVSAIVDLGANIGLTTVYLAARHGAEYLLAVEPVPSNAALVRKNLALNGLVGTVIEGVVGGGEGIAHFREAAQSNAGHLSHEGIEVRALDIRAILDQLEVDTVDLLKIDIEGAEQELLSGDRAWLTRVRSLIIEFHPGAVDYERLIAILQGEGFRHIPRGSVYTNSTSAFIRDQSP